MAFSRPQVFCLEVEMHQTVPMGEPNTNPRPSATSTTNRIDSMLLTLWWWRPGPVLGVWVLATTTPQTVTRQLYRSRHNFKCPEHTPQRAGFATPCQDFATLCPHIRNRDDIRQGYARFRPQSVRCLGKDVRRSATVPMVR